MGKTETTLLLTEYIFGDVQKHCIRLDMSEYQNQESLQLLLGQNETSRGNIGRFYDRAEGRGFLLFDEIEKAHPDVFNMLLQILEDGRLTDAKGRTVDFKNTLLILTSNIGSKVIEKGGSGIGFEFAEDAAESQYNRIRSLVNEELKQYFPS